MARIAASVVLMFLAVVSAGGCADRVGTVGNTSIWFWSDLQDERWDEAYGWLCSSEKERFSKEEFADSGGGPYAGLVTIQSGLGSWSQYRDLDTLDSDITRAWTEIAGVRRGTTEVTRLFLVREDGDWKVCGIEVNHLDEVVDIPTPQEADEMPGGPY
jgi:hypothetical protein